MEGEGSGGVQSRDGGSKRRVREGEKGKEGRGCCT